MDRRADVVMEARKRELLGPTTTPRSVCAFVNVDAQGRAPEDQRGGEAVRTRANDDRIRFAQQSLAVTRRVDVLARRQVGRIGGALARGFSPASELAIVACPTSTFAFLGSPSHVNE